MPVTVTYPGVYIEELPSTSHSVAAAPTSVAVFVGYTHPFRTVAFDTAVQLFSFADYQANFGGFFSSPWLPDYVGQAVYQFFLNGGSTAWVVGLQATTYFDDTKTPPKNQGAVVAAAAAAVKTGVGFTFSALTPVGVPASGAVAAAGIPMQVSISNVDAAGDSADVILVYGTTVETYRRLPFASAVATISGQSSLATVALAGAATSYTGLAGTYDFVYAAVPSAAWSVIDPTAFAPIFAANASLDKVPVFNLLVAPGITDPAVLAQALAYSEGKRAFLIMDPPANAVADSLATGPANPQPIADLWNGGTIPTSANGAIYFPYLQSSDPITGLPSVAPPSGFVAGIFAREDDNRGVWKSPAGLETTILGSTGVVDWGRMTDPQQGVLNGLGINCIRQFPGIGSVVFGARTLVSGNPAYEQWKYVAVRRMALFLEQSLYASLTWAVFEPNDTPLWNALTQEVSAFMLGLFRQGAFQGATPSAAFLVRCDSTTTTPTDVANGVVNILVGFAPLEPAEFVVVQIAQLAGQAQS